MGPLTWGSDKPGGSFLLVFETSSLFQPSTNQALLWADVRTEAPGGPGFDVSQAVS